MKFAKICAATFVAFSLPACVVLDTLPPEAIGPGPFLTGGSSGGSAAPARAAPAPDPAAPVPAAAPPQQGPSLRDQLVSQTLLRTSGNGEPSMYLRSDNALYVDIAFAPLGTWRVFGSAFCHTIDSVETCFNVTINGNQATLSNLGGTSVYRIERL